MPSGCIRHNSVDYEPTSNLICFKMASILKFQSRDRKHGGTCRNHCEIIIFSSPENKMLRVSYCDRPTSGVRRPLSVVRQQFL